MSSELIDSLFAPFDLDGVIFFFPSVVVSRAVSFSVGVVIFFLLFCMLLCGFFFFRGGDGCGLGCGVVNTGLWLFFNFFF